jgi:hypothetical protein
VRIEYDCTLSCTGHQSEHDRVGTCFAPSERHIYTHMGMARRLQGEAPDEKGTMRESACGGSAGARRPQGRSPPQSTTENGALTGVGAEWRERRGPVSPQRSESGQRLETGRESDEAVAPRATVPSASETRDEARRAAAACTHDGRGCSATVSTRRVRDRADGLRPPRVPSVLG